MDWFSSEYLPDEFYLHEAIAIDLKHSDLRFVLKEPQVFYYFQFSIKPQHLTKIQIVTYYCFISTFFSNVCPKTYLGVGFEVAEGP